MRRWFILLSVLLTVALITPELYAQRRRRRVRDDDVETKNVYELVGRLKSVEDNGKVLVMNIPNEERTEVEVMAFKITGETKCLGLREGQELSDVPEGNPLRIVYRSLNAPDYKGTALFVRVLQSKPDAPQDDTDQ